MNVPPFVLWMKNNWRYVFVISIPLLLSIVPIVSPSQEAKCGYVIMIMAFFWMTEVIPIAVTALIPVFAFPIFGILSTPDVCMIYMKSTNVMFMGGLMVAVAVEHCNLHKRIALFVILYVGQSPARLMAGFMLVTSFLSMWIFNTASTAMMVPIVNAILEELYPSDGSEKKKDINVVYSIERESSDHNSLEMGTSGVENKGYVEDDLRSEGTGASASKIDINYATKSEEKETQEQNDNEHKLSERDLMTRALYFGVAYSANIGGTGVVTGTSPNLVLMSVLSSSFSSPTGLNFATWIAFNVPGLLICIFLAWIWLQVLFMGLFRKNRDIKKPSKEQEEAVRLLIFRKYKELGRITQHELTVLLLFFILVALWLLRAPGFIGGWSTVFTHDKKIGDASSVMLIVLLLFAMPTRFELPWSKEYKKNPPKEGPRPCLTWEVIHEKVPWNIVILLGGGYAMAEGVTTSGLSKWLGLQFEGLQELPKEAIVLVVCLLAAMITEVASNGATASILLPVLKEMALKINVNPLYLMLPATICCSYAFMLPVATAPNAIVLTAAKMKSTDMIKAGFVMNLMCIAVINIMINTLGVVMFDLHNMPPWTTS